MVVRRRISMGVTCANSRQLRVADLRTVQAMISAREAIPKPPRVRRFALAHLHFPHRVPTLAGPPPGPNAGDFVNVAHALWTLLFAAIGGCLAYWLYATGPGRTDEPEAPSASAG